MAEAEVKGKMKLSFSRSQQLRLQDAPSSQLRQFRIATISTPHPDWEESRGSSLDGSFIRLQTRGGRAPSVSDVEPLWTTTDQLSELEMTGEWIKCQETIAGRYLWYHSNSRRIIFDQQRSQDNIKEAPAKASESTQKKIIPDEDFTKNDLIQDLLKFDEHEWDFANERIQHYRTLAAEVDHSQHQPKHVDMCFPRYFSESSLPPELDKVYATVKLPQSKNDKKDLHTTTKIALNVNRTTADDATKKVVEKLRSGDKLVEKYMLKVLGRKEYLYGKDLIVRHSAIREAVRNEDDVMLSLVRVENKEEQIAEAKSKLEKHKETLKSTYDEKYYENREENLKMFDDSEICTKKDHLANGKRVGQKISKLNFFNHDMTYRVKLLSLMNVRNLERFDKDMTRISVRFEVWCGAQLITTPGESSVLTSTLANHTKEVMWGQWLSRNRLTWRQFPIESTMSVMVYGHIGADTTGTCLAWSRFPIIDQYRRLISGPKTIILWEIPTHKKTKDGPKEDPYMGNPFTCRGTCVPKTIDMNKVKRASELPMINIRFDEFMYEVVVPNEPELFLAKQKNPKIAAGLTNNSPDSSPLFGLRESLYRGAKHDKFVEEMTPVQESAMNKIFMKNSLDSMESQDKKLVWSLKHCVSHKPEALPFVLLSCDWTNWQQKMEMRNLIWQWETPEHMEDLLELLDYRFVDEEVRRYAVEKLDLLDDAALGPYLLQLCQCLKYEIYHRSHLSRWLLRRGLKSPYQIGHFLFWNLKAELHDPRHAERFGLILEEYLLHAHDHISKNLCIQQNVIDRLTVVAENVVHNLRVLKLPKIECKNIMKSDLKLINDDLPETFQVTLNPRWNVTKINIDKCRFMSSKKVPLWLNLENADPQAEGLIIMFKAGDDLRQDMLTLQIFNIMDKVWLDKNLDLRLKPYRVIATGVNSEGEGVGMLQIVRNSTTINDVNSTYGGVRTGAWRKENIWDYIKNNNPSDKLLEKAAQNFVRSCAGYVIATWVTGIGDRHSSNIMITQSGQFFHIDFGHFLGNFKSKMGVKRERSPFVFTYSMQHVMHEGSQLMMSRNKEIQVDLFADFQEWCHSAFNIIRSRHRFFCNLFTLMIPAEMPELTKSEDIRYLLAKLKLQLSSEQAKAYVEKEIEVSLKDTYRLWDQAIHSMVHA